MYQQRKRTKVQGPQVSGDPWWSVAMSGQLTSLLVQVEIYKPINLINNCQCKNASILWPFNLSLIMLDLPADIGLVFGSEPD